jgi:hypothetical protein
MLLYEIGMNIKLSYNDVKMEGNMRWEIGYGIKGIGYEMGHEIGADMKETGNSQSLRWQVVPGAF